MSDTAGKQDYSAKLRLPKTDFPMRAGLSKQEPLWVQRWLEEDVYGKLHAKRVAEGAPKFILHLGPPYANGNFHMGHALTYVLKDFIVRSKFMAGFDSPYVPGWDCHGLPIEWKVEQNLRENGQTKHDVTVQELRDRCRAYAQKWIDVQKAEWQRLGALADWERPYKTMDKANEAGIVRELGKLVQRGLVYRGLRSTQWSWAEETALAEAEVEYKDVVSKAVYVALPVVDSDNEFVVIWTTTPWTLPANRAVAVKADEDYALVVMDAKKYWVAEALREDFAKALGQESLRAHRTLKGREIAGWRIGHPLYEGVSGPLLEGFHVTTESGTGLVHIAPAHGQEDFTIGQQNGLDVTCPVLGDGTYAEDVPPLPQTGVALAGQLIWKAQKDILAELEESGRLLKVYDYPHSYPVSWRSKKELIFRTTHQWFVALDGVDIPETGKDLRQSSLDRIYARDGVKGVKWVPEYGQNRIGSMIENRPDWCISRQRAWGVPITVMVEKANGEIVADEAVWAHIAALVEAEGIDAWDSRLDGREAELFPAGWLEANGKSADDFEYVRDILDVWFDSGTTHAHVLRADPDRFGRSDGKRPADLYQEGSDQHRGWFHSSLLTSVANYGDAPYEEVVTSGFVVDGEGRKFSKSLGNGVEPRDLLDKYGMDIVRLWVASADYSEDIRYSPTIMDGMADAYRRFRNTFRWLLGNLNGYDGTAVDYDDLPELEQYILYRFGNVLTAVRGHFDSYQFHKAYRELYEFCGGDLSNFYFDVRKDVLYCDPARSKERQGCLAVLDILFRGLATHLAPILPFTTDEAWRSRMGDESVHLQRFAEVAPDYVELTGAWEVPLDFMMDLRGGMLVALEKLRGKGEIGSNLDAMVTVYLSGLWRDSSGDNLHGCEDLLRTMLGVSEVKIKDVDVLPAEAEALEGVSNISVICAKHPGHKCPRCWRYYEMLEDSGVCRRCDEALKEQEKAAA